MLSIKNKSITAVVEDDGMNDCELLETKLFPKFIQISDLFQPYYTDLIMMLEASKSTYGALEGRGLGFSDGELRRPTASSQTY